jgi:hypothetical protein
MLINRHVLNEATASGNGHHGNCVHCELALVTDLGYCSWDGTACNNRQAELSEYPKDVLNYAHFRGLVYDGSIFVKPYSGETYTPDQLYTIIQNL